MKVCKKYYIEECENPQYSHTEECECESCGKTWTEEHYTSGGVLYFNGNPCGCPEPDGTDIEDNPYYRAKNGMDDNV